MDKTTERRQTMNCAKPDSLSQGRSISGKAYPSVGQFLLVYIQLIHEADPQGF